MRWVVAPLIASLCFAIPTVASARPFTFDDYYRIVGVDGAQISPDGKRVVITVSHIDRAADKSLHELVLVDVATGVARALTHDRNDAGAAQWSPDGTELAFVDVAGSGDDAAPQVWIMPMDGGDARPVTNAKHGVDTYAWRPDGKAIAYVTQDDSPNQAAIAQHNRLFKVGDNSFLTQGVPATASLWVQDLNGGSPVRLTDGSGSIYPDKITWSADGRYIAFDHLPDAYNHFYTSRVAVIDVQTKSITMPNPDRWSWQPTFALSGDRLAYAAGTHNTAAIQQDLVVSHAGNRGSEQLGASIDRDVALVGWMSNGDAVVTGDDHVTKALWAVSGTDSVRRIDLGDVEFDGGSVARNGAIAFIGTTPTRPDELYYLAPGTDQPRRLTNYNAWMSDLELAPAREFTWRNDGFDEDGALTYPLGYQQGKKYPLVLVIHGGPTIEASTLAFNPLVQLLAARGFVVLQPNYRGSDNLGFRYADAIVGRVPIAGPGADCVAGVKALEATGRIDASRIGVYGWSAGGWTTSWLITHYDLWKAAATGAGLDDVILQYTNSDINGYMPIIFGGLTPWNGGMSAYLESSPLSSAQNVHAATLIISDTGDYRVPTPQAYEFYTALRDLGKTVEFVAIPAIGHHPSDPVSNLEIDRTIVEWMVRYLTPSS